MSRGRKSGVAYKHDCLAGLTGPAYRRAWFGLMRLKHGPGFDYKSPVGRWCACGRPAVKRSCGDFVCAVCADLEAEAAFRDCRKALAGVAAGRSQADAGRADRVVATVAVAPAAEGGVARAWREFRAQMNVSVPGLKSFAERNWPTEDVL